MFRRVMKPILMGTCLALLMNCQSAINNYQDPEFAQYVAEFSRYGKMASQAIPPRVQNVSVIFGKVDENAYAWCDLFANQIVVDKAGWVKLSHAEREELLFHEMGHCVLNLDHEDGTIMQAKGLLGSVYYTTNYNFLLNYLFGCTGKPCIPREDYNADKYKPIPKEHKLTTKEILDNEHAVVRFTASWCPPCKALAPVFDEVATAHPDVKVYVIDVDQHKDIASDLNVRGIPTCMVIRGKKVDVAIVGNQPKPELEKLFK